MVIPDSSTKETLMQQIEKSITQLNDDSISISIEPTLGISLVIERSNGNIHATIVRPEKVKHLSIIGDTWNILHVNNISNVSFKNIYNHSNHEG